MTTPDLAGTTRDLTGAGTAEARWRSSRLLAELPRVEPGALRPPGRVVVVAPHPDDEVLGLGGTLAAWAATGVGTVVVAVTDGEASHPDSPTVTGPELAGHRADERARALGVLGLGGAEVLRAGLPDGAVGAHGDALADLLERTLDPEDTLLAPLRGDGHPDHDAAAHVAARVADRRRVALRGYAVWLWHWAAPDDPDLPREGAVAVALPDEAHRAKAAAVECFTTQIRPLSADPRDAAILPARVRARLLREFEVLWTP